MIPSITALPRHLWRTSSSAQPTPKRVLSGTATATIKRVSQIACSASGEVIASIGGPIPCSKVFQKIRPTGASSSAPR